MKICKASYMDDGVTIPGALVKRFLRKPVFYVADPSCGWDRQVITKAEQSKVVKWISKPGVGRSRGFCNTEGAVQSSDDMYREAINMTVASGKADEILNSDKAQALSVSNRLEFDRDFFCFCTSHCCRSDCKSRSDYCPIADEVREKHNRFGGEECAQAFARFKEQRSAAKE